MLRSTNTTVKFEYKVEDGQNPDIGFMSYQHFRDERLYSDCIVNADKNMTETENLECYPVPDGIEEKGREQGCFPDTSIAYIRFLWKEFEPRRGVYNYDFIRGIISKTKECKQTLILRMMPHSTCERDDVPDWLKTIISCPERPYGMRVKDSPTDPKFIGLFCDAIRALGKKFDTESTLDSIDISLPGAWGEGHNLHLYSDESLEELYNTYTSVFKNTRLICQMRSPELLKRISEDNKVGIRADGFGEPNHVNNLYPPCMQILSDMWKSSPVSFESYWWIGEWYRKNWDVDKLIELSLDWHISSFNAKSMPVPHEWKDKMDFWVSKMGYHFTFDYFYYTNIASPGDDIQFEFCIDNVGVAPMYHHGNVWFRLSGVEKYDINSDVDVMGWLPGKHKSDLTLHIPENVHSGKYIIEVAILKNNHEPIYIATNAKNNDRYYCIGEIEII